MADARNLPQFVSLLSNFQLSQANDADSNAFDETFTVNVGTAPGPIKSFTVHVGVATFHSGFFAAALKKDTFKEGKQNSVNLPEEKIDDFQNFFFMGLMYNGSVTSDDADPYIPLVHLWIMADQYNAPRLANTVIDLIHKLAVSSEKSPDAALLLAYQETVEYSPLREFLLEIAVTGLGADIHKKGTARDDWTAQIYRDVLFTTWQDFSYFQVEGTWKDRVSGITPDEYYADTADLWRKKSGQY